MNSFIAAQSHAISDAYFYLTNRINKSSSSTSGSWKE